MLQHYLTTTEAVKYIEQTIKQPVSYYDLDNLIRANAINPPELVAGRRVWSRTNLKEACKAIRIRRSKRPNLALKKLFHSNGNEEVNQ